MSREAAMTRAIGGQLITSVLPLVQAVIVDDVITDQVRPLAPWLTLMIALGLARFIFAYNRRYRGGRIALDVQHDLRTSVFRQLQQLDFARHDELQTGQLVSRASADVTLIQGFLQFLPIGVATSSALPALAVGLAALLAKLFGLALLVVLVESTNAKLRFFRVPELMAVALGLGFLALAMRFF